jgi:hypothetical protein
MRILRAFIVISCFLLPVYGQIDCATDNLIKVRDLNGKFVAGAKVRLFEAATRKFALSTNKVKDGAYLFKDIMGQFHDDQGKSWLVSEQYILIVGAPGFEEFEQNATFRNCHPTVIEVVLRPASVVTGVVYDDNGAVIPGVIVKFRGGNNSERSTKTNEAGEYEITLKAGNYSVETESPPGFQTLKMEKFRVAPSYKGKLSLDLVLEVGPCPGCHGIEVGPIEAKKPN